MKTSSTEEIILVYMVPFVPTNLIVLPCAGVSVRSFFAAGPSSVTSVPGGRNKQNEMSHHGMKSLKLTFDQTDC